MINAVLGSIIMMIASTALFSAVEVIELALSDAARQPLSSSEQELLCSARLREDSNPSCLKSLLSDDSVQIQFWQDNLRRMPRSIVSSQ